LSQRNQPAVHATKIAPNQSFVSDSDPRRKRKSWVSRFFSGLLGFIIGAWISDTLISHWGLYALGYRPYTGLRSTVLYVIEAAALLTTFQHGLWLSGGAAFWGLVCGAGFFILVLPVMRAVRVTAAPWRREPWVPWQPLSVWTKP
jgi:hypothetical protein